MSEVQQTLFEFCPIVHWNTMKTDVPPQFFIPWGQEV